MGRADKPGQEAPENPGDFLARWSRRKLEADDEAARPDGPDAVIALPSEAQADAPQARGPEPEPELTDADMPPVETLDADSDYAPFMSPGVSDGLRQKALRILFNQPACNITDGLNDYDDDYTQFASLGSVVTHEMKRMLMRELEAEKNRQLQTDARAQEACPADTDAPVDPSLEQAQSADPGQLETDADAAADQGQASPGRGIP
jgi:hypothetical protein